MSASLLPLGQLQFFDANGNPLAGGFVYTYEAGTTTFKTTWQDSGETIANTNPIVLDASGSAVIWGSGTYSMLVQDINGNQIWSRLTSTVALPATQAPVTATNNTGGNMAASTTYMVSINYTAPAAGYIYCFAGHNLTNSSATGASITGTLVANTTTLSSDVTGLTQWHQGVFGVYANQTVAVSYTIVTNSVAPVAAATLRVGALFQAS